MAAFEEIVAVLVGELANNRDAQRGYLRAIWEHTNVLVSRKGGYYNRHGKFVPLGVQPDLVSQVRVCPASSSYERFAPRFAEGTKFSVVNGDCVDVAADMCRRGRKPFMMDAASRSHFGGGYANGARAQEESLCRRSNLAFFVDPKRGHQKRPDLYPLPPTSGIYVPAVDFFRMDARCSFRVLDCPATCGVGIVAAFNRPQIDPATKLMVKDVADDTRTMLRTFFEMAYDNQHDAVVCVALGCGAFQNPAQHIAALFADVVKSIPPGCFKEVTFAVFDDHNSYHQNNPEGNFVPFARVVKDLGGDVDGTGESIWPSEGQTAGETENCVVWDGYNPAVPPAAPAVPKSHAVVPCKYGAQCFRQDPTHLARFSHPPKE